MSIYEAAKQALDALEVWRDSLTDQSAISELRFCVVGEKAITALRTALAEDVPETNFGNMEQVVDCYGDGNVYQGRPSKDSETKTITFSKVETVEPVAYVTGYFEGRCVIKPFDSMLLPVGMALYRLPPASQESRQVEPVAWMRPDRGHICFHKHSAYVPLYPAPPKRDPLTEAELEPIRRRMMYEAYNAANDGDCERYNALKVMANDVLEMLLGVKNELQTRVD